MIGYGTTLIPRTEAMMLCLSVIQGLLYQSINQSINVSGTAHKNTGKNIVHDVYGQMEASSNAVNNDVDVDENIEDDVETADSPLETTCQEIEDDNLDQNDDFVEDVEFDGSGNGNRRSLVWKYFTFRQTCALCKLCRKSLKRSSGNTSNLSQHLRAMHRRQYVVMMAEYRRRKSEAAALKEVC